MPFAHAASIRLRAAASVGFADGPSRPTVHLRLLVAAALPAHLRPDTGRLRVDLKQARADAPMRCICAAGFRARMRTHAHAHAHAHEGACTYEHASKRMCTRARTHARTRAHMDSFTRTSARARASLANGQRRSRRIHRRRRAHQVNV
jgi:hypothetical protein